MEIQPRPGRSRYTRGTDAEPTRDRFRLDVLRMSLFLFIVISISTVHAYFGFLRVLRLGLLLWVVTVGCVFLMPRSVDWSNLFKSWPPKAVLIIIGIAFLSAPFGLSLGASGQFLLNVYIRVAAFFLILVAAIRGVRDLAFFVWAFVASGAILAALAMTVMEIAPSGGGDRLVAAHMYDANDIGLIFLCAIPLAVLLFKAFDDWRRPLAGVCLALMAAAVAMTGSRGAFVGFLVVVPGIFLALKDLSIVKRLATVGALVAGLALGAPEGYWDRITTVFNPQDDYNVTDDYGRLAVAKRGLGYMATYPFLGVGVANFPRAEGTISPRARNAMAGEAIRFLAPHNTFVQVGAELGVFALGIWLSLFFLGTFGLRRLGRRLGSRIRDPGEAGFERRFLGLCCTYLPITFMAFATTSFFVSHLYTPIFYVLLAILGGTLFMTRRVLARDRLARLAGSGTGGPLRPASASRRSPVPPPHSLLR